MVDEHLCFSLETVWWKPNMQPHNWPFFHVTCQSLKVFTWDTSLRQINLQPMGWCCCFNCKCVNIAGILFQIWVSSSCSSFTFYNFLLFFTCLLSSFPSLFQFVKLQPLRIMFSCSLWFLYNTSTSASFLLWHLFSFFFCGTSFLSSLFLLLLLTSLNLVFTRLLTIADPLFPSYFPPQHQHHSYSVPERLITYSSYCPQYLVFLRRTSLDNINL